MKIVIDENIPFIRNVFEPFAEVIYSPGKEIDGRMVRDADALIVRTRTKCDGQLLKGSRVRIVATATIGIDHIDTKWCEDSGIKWVSAPGCNSGSVMQYVTAALFHLASRYSLDLPSLTLGVVGVGNVGSKVVKAARAIGLNVLQNDPPRKRREGLADFVTLEKLLKESDIVTLHVPLTLEGHDKTHYLLNASKLQALKRDCFIINTSRGEVVDGNALLRILKDELIGGAVLDVWEGEPAADPGLVKRADIATPHIAGYSVDGKANGTIMVVREVAAQLHIPLTDWIPSSLPEPEKPDIDLDPYSRRHNASQLAGLAVKHTYPIAEDDLLFRTKPEKFESFRNTYRIRREFGSFNVKIKDNDAQQILSGLGFGIAAG